MLAGVNMQLPD